MRVPGYVLHPLWKVVTRIGAVQVLQRASLPRVVAERRAWRSACAGRPWFADEPTQSGCSACFPPQSGDMHALSGWGASAAPHRWRAPASLPFEVIGRPELCLSVLPDAEDMSEALNMRTCDMFNLLDETFNGCV